VEVQAADGSWRTVPTEAFMDFDRPAELPPREQEEMSGTNVPPPAAIPPPSTVGEPTDAELNSLRNKRDADEDFALPAWLKALLLYVGLPLLAVLAVAGAIVGAKAWRRRRRRSAEPVSARFAGGWREVTDHARDLGLAITGATRREEALALAGAGSPGRRRGGVLGGCGLLPRSPVVAGHAGSPDPRGTVAEDLPAGPLRAAANWDSLADPPTLACRPNVGRVSWRLAAARITRRAPFTGSHACAGNWVPRDRCTRSTGVAELVSDRRRFAGRR
jgi:hypothetical protein